MAQGGARTFLSVPALDWVARDGESYSYSVELYGPQDDVDPFLPDAGNGVLEDGTPITWNDPADAATPWDTDDVRTWLAGLSTQPDVAAVGNELDICAQTHRDVHPEPMGYDELLQRVTDTAAVIRDELPGTAIAGPSSCCWWYYWNDDAGEKPLHGGQDLLPWFLDQLAEADAAAGQRSLDILDIHYYPESEVFNDGTDPDTAARRLRATRSLWDPTYTDEGWIGDDTDATVHQPDPNQVQLIPRFRALIDEHYPGTELAIGEWNFGADAHLSGGLATADALGIFGRQQLHMATFWSFPAEGTPAAAAFQLYRDPDHPFGDRSLRTAVDDPDQLGLHAALDDSGGLTLVAINKDPDRDLLLQLDGLPAGELQTRQFGGPLAGQVVPHPPTDTTGQLLLPAYSALFLAMDEAPVGDDDIGDDDDDDDDDDSSCSNPDDCDCRQGDGSSVDHSALVAALLASFVLRRRRS
jgi:phosphatidylinositol glycan class B